MVGFAALSSAVLWLHCVSTCARLLTLSRFGHAGHNEATATEWRRYQCVSVSLWLFSVCFLCVSVAVPACVCVLCAQLFQDNELCAWVSWEETFNERAVTSRSLSEHLVDGWGGN